MQDIFIASLTQVQLEKINIKFIDKTTEEKKMKAKMTYLSQFEQFMLKQLDRVMAGETITDVDYEALETFAELMYANIENECAAPEVEKQLIRICELSQIIRRQMDANEERENNIED